MKLKVFTIPADASNIAASSRHRAAIAAPTTTNATWGTLPAIIMIGSFGLLLIACAYTIARRDVTWATPLFWLGMLVVFVPIAGRLSYPTIARGERVGLVVLLGMYLYLIKVLHSPSLFTFADELMHWRTADDILRRDELFRYNALLPISAYYPGLEIVTAALCKLTGLSIFASGVIVLGAARLVFVTGLYLFFEYVSRSPYLAGLASLLYMANPNYVFFGAQFAYESLSLPLMTLVLVIVAYGERVPPHDYWRVFLVALPAAAAVVVTHHLTTYALIVILLGWTLALLVCKSWSRACFIGALVSVILLLSVLWSTFVAPRTSSYLIPQFNAALVELKGLLRGEMVGRRLFSSSTGQVSPLWERLTGLASVGLIMLVLPLGLRSIWRRYRGAAAALALALLTLAYPLSLVLRFTRLGAEISNRSSEFLFVALAFVLAAGIVRLQAPAFVRQATPALFVVWSLIVFSGGVIIGWAPWARLPGPYMVIADSRSIEPEGVAAATWMRDLVGPRQRLATDRINRLLMGSYGRQSPITSYGNQLQVSLLFLSPTLGDEERDIIHQGDITYAVVDQRLSASLPTLGIYFERGEPRSAEQRKHALDIKAIEKFDQLRGVGRVFDSGNLVVYDLQELSREP